MFCNENPYVSIFSPKSLFLNVTLFLNCLWSNYQFFLHAWHSHIIFWYMYKYIFVCDFACGAMNVCMHICICLFAYVWIQLHDRVYICICRPMLMSKGFCWMLFTLLSEKVSLNWTKSSHITVFSFLCVTQEDSTK